MIALLWLVTAILASPFKSKYRLGAENAVLRHQVMVLRRQARDRIHPTNLDRLFLVQLYRWFPSILRVLAIVQPETIIRWHRAGFCYYWRWKSRSRGGRPAIGSDLRALIRQMSIDNPLWGAPRIHGELLKLGSRRRICAVGIRDKPIAPASPWQNGFAERLIGSIRRDCLDHLVIVSEAHLRGILQTYACYYNKIKTHRSLNKDAPAFRLVQRVGNIESHAILGGLHHHYVRA